MRYIIKNINKNKFFYKNINENIKFKEIRLIEENGKQLGIFLLKDALNKSKIKNMDLIMIDNKKNPPICKIMDYGKFIYEKNKFLKNQKKKQNNYQIKEIQIRQNIEQQDYLIKLNKLRNFLVNKNKVKIILRFKGREIVHNDIGFNLLNKIKEDLNDISIVEFISNKIEGRSIIMILSFKKK